MPELLQATCLTEQQFFELATSTQHNSVRSEIAPHSSVPDTSKRFASGNCGATYHWTKRLRDPLGDALARIKSGNQQAKSSEHATNETAPSTVEQSALSATSIQPELPVTLPMFAAEDATCDSVTPASDHVNRRKFPRRHSECRVALVRRSETDGLTPQQIDWLLDSGRSIGRLQDLSQLGICLLLKHDIPAETEVLLRISNEKLGRPVDVSADVIRSLPAHPGAFSIHCQTQRNFTLDELQDLGQPIPPAQIFAAQSE
jgi:hypothetical protein